jgi:hypothetical protein
MMLDIYSWIFRFIEEITMIRFLYFAFATSTAFGAAMLAQQFTGSLSIRFIAAMAAVVVLDPLLSYLATSLARALRGM